MSNFLLLSCVPCSIQQYQQQQNILHKYHINTYTIFYERSYNQNSTAGPQLELQTEKIADWEQERTRNRVALGTLLQINPNTQQVQIILRRIGAFNIRIRKKL